MASKCKFPFPVYAVLFDREGQPGMGRMYWTRRGAKGWLKEKGLDHVKEWRDEGAYLAADLVDKFDDDDHLLKLPYGVVLMVPEGTVYTP